MKKFSKMVAMMMAAAMLACLVSFAGTGLTVHADEPVTYVVKYLEDEKEVRYQVGNDWQEGSLSRELYYLQQSIKDGDLVVIQAKGDTIELKLNARLNNVTIVDGAAIITTNGIENCYTLNDSVLVVNGDVVNAYAYANSTANYNDSVVNLEIIGDDDINANVAVLGTVDYVRGYDKNKTYYTLYNVKEGAFYALDGALKVDPSKYSTVPPVVTVPETVLPPATSAPETVFPPATSAPETVLPPTTSAPETVLPPATSAPETVLPPATSAPQTPAAPSGEYDDVPKTGDMDLSVWMFGLAAVCCLGGYALRRTQA